MGGKKLRLESLTGILVAQAAAALCLPGLAAAQISFNNTTDAAGLSGNATESFGASWGDMNADGYPDLFIGNHRDVSRMWLNNGNGTFADITDSATWSNAFDPKDKHGAAFVDLDADGDKDLVMTVSTTNGHYLFSDGVSRFSDIGPSIGLQLQHDNGSRMPVAFDANGDGRIDLKVIGNRENQSNFFRQNNDGSFTLVGNQLGMSCPLGTQWGQLIDINASGTLELLCGSGSAFPSKVIDYNSGFGSSVNFAATRRSRDGIAGDFNNDGRQDIMHVMGSFRLNEALRVTQTRVEAHVVITAGVPSRTITIDTGGRLQVELDVDNWNFITSKGGSASDVYIGAGGYNPASLSLDLHPSGANLGVQAPGNRDGMFIGYVDGQWSITVNAVSNTFNTGYFVIDSNQFISSATMTPAIDSDDPFAPLLQLNLPGGFVDATAGSGLTAERCVSGIAADLDNDMDLDVFLGCRKGAQNLENVVFENLGNGTFQKVINHGGEGVTGATLEQGAGVSESVIWADYDVDGFVDVFVSNGLHLFPFETGGPSEIFRNNGNSNNWVQIDLVGVASNRDAVGAKVRLTAGGLTQYREQNGGYHRWSQNTQRIHFGLAGNSTANLEIEWPSGQVDTYSDVDANKLYRATEGQGLVEAMGGQNNGEPFCGEPSYSRSVDRGTFIWKDCDGTGEWKIRTTGGGTPSGLNFTADIKLPGGPISLSTFSYEASDTLDGNPDPDIVSYEMRIWGSGEDGINFVAPADSCFTPGQPSGLPVYVGRNRTELQTATLDLQTGGACPNSGGSDDVCGAPAISASSERATFLWKDCDGGNQWHARMTGGGIPGLSLFEGRIDATGGLLSLTEFSIEASDVLDQVSDPNALIYALRLYNNGIDGFEFVPPANACFTPVGLTTVLLGANKVPMQTANLDLTTGLQCGGETEVSACGMPSINYATDNAAFVWQDCNTGEWSARFSAASRFTLYEGTVTSDQGFTQVSGVDLEGTDTLDVSSNEVFYNLRIGAGFDDGFDFSTPAGSNGCFDLQLPAGSPVLIGQNRTPIATPFDLETLGACSAIP